MNLDELKTALTALGANAALQLLAAVEQHIDASAKIAREKQDEAARQIDTLQERLRQAMARESELKAANAQLSAGNARLTSELDRLSAHPEVRAAKRARLAAQAADLHRQIAALADPAPEAQAE